MELKCKEYSVGQYSKKTGLSIATIRRRCEQKIYRSFKTEGGEKRGGVWKIVEVEGDPYLFNSHK